MSRDRSAPTVPVKIARAIVFAAVFAGIAPAAGAATITVTTTSEDPDTTSTACSLRAAIIAANTDASRGGCPAGDPGIMDTIVLRRSATYALTLRDHSDDAGSWYGPNGLPPITSSILIEGNGATIERAASATTAFRLFYVCADPTKPATLDYPTRGPGA